MKVNHRIIGIGVSPGISIGKAYILKKKEAAFSGSAIVNDEEKETEIGKFNQSVISALAEIESIRSDKNRPQALESLDILDTQAEFLDDPQIREDVYAKIRKDSLFAYDAVIEVFGSAILMFRNFEDDYLSARAADLQDIRDRILRNLNSDCALHHEYHENTILISKELSPSETMSLDTAKVIGFATQLGGKTSHTAILGKAKGIPAVVGCSGDLESIQNNETIILDGFTGDLILNPDLNTLQIYAAKQQITINEQALLKSLKDQPATTTDGHRVQLYANISNAGDLEQVFENGGEGIGLLRTEMLFLERETFPTEEEQFNFYKQVAIQSKNIPVIIRTLDIGGDKQLTYFGIPPENNPCMGYRAIRICLDQQEIFFRQLRAILRASIFGKFKIMFPMICNLSEIREAKSCLDQVKKELADSGIDFDTAIEIGMMIEIPSAALMADKLASEVDFFSIGTNDLCQYTLAVDRMNDKVSALYSHFDPGVLRLIGNVIEQAHKLNKPVSLCGEMASDPLATLLLLGMGLDELSMNARSIPTIKNNIIKNSVSKAAEILKRVMEMDNSESIINYLQEVIQ
ncbi:MAG: phosphoenolpyruvate--protein phosphotransferase [Mariniphaga sp.]